jgi:hypothetical protein
MALINVNGKRFKNFMAKLYGIGAAIVILGALFKILHLKGADQMLIIGLTTESVIFFLSAFEAPAKEYDWSLIYPELSIDEDGSGNGPRGTVTQELDKMMAEAKIGPELLDSLGDGMRKLSDTAASLNNAKSMEALNALYSVQLENSTNQMEMQNNLMEKLGSAGQQSEALATEVEKMAGNLTQLNSVYGNMLAAMNLNRS